MAPHCSLLSCWLDRGNFCSEHVLLAVFLPPPQVKVHSLKLPHKTHAPEKNEK